MIDVTLEICIGTAANGTLMPYGCELYFSNPVGG